jgi:hypothetical protein
MKDEGDPFEILRGINPVDPTTLPDPARQRGALEAMESILRADAVGSREGRRFRWLRALRYAPRRRVYLVPIVAVAVLGAATLAWALTRGPTQHLSVGCYVAVDLDARTVVVPATEASPVETCEKVWLDGVFGRPPPPLQACVLPSGAVGVFPNPGGNSCEQLNLAPAPAGSEPVSAVVELQNALVDRFLERCIAESEARRIVLGELRRLRLEDWRVATSGRFDSTRPCTSLAFDEARSEVLLVPIPQ